VIADRAVHQGDRLVVAIIAERRHLGNRALYGARASLESAGCLVPLVVPDAGTLMDIPSSAPPWDAVLSRGRDLAGLGMLAAAAALGVLAINSTRSIELVRNKIAMQAVLLSHGLPVPRTHFASDPRIFADLEPARFPMVVKPFDGDGARGLALLTKPSDVGLLAPPSGPRTLYLAQEFLETDGYDLKLYGIGSDVWAVRKASPVRFLGPGPVTLAPTDEARRVELDASLRDIALTCGRACGLELWGVDVALTPRGPYVIEVNDFPTYSAVPEAGAAIADHVLALTRLRALSRAQGRERMLTILRDPP